MEDAPKDRSILAAWGNESNGAFGYDVVKYTRTGWISVASGDYYNSKGYLPFRLSRFELLGWNEIPAFE